MAALKTKPAKNTLEQFENVAADAWDETQKVAKDAVRTIAEGISSQVSFSSWLGLEPPLSPEAVKAKEDEELMRKIEGYKEIFRKIDAIEGRVTDERALDEKVRKYIEEEKKRATESFVQMKSEHRSEAERLGAPPRGEIQKKQAEQQKEAAKEDEERKEKEEKRARLENVIEAPPGKITGLSFKGKRKSNPRRGTPRATAKLRSPETRANRE